MTELALCASGKGEEGSLGGGGWGDVAKTNIRTTEQPNKRRFWRERGGVEDGEMGKRGERRGRKERVE